MGLNHCKKKLKTCGYNFFNNNKENDDVITNNNTVFIQDNRKEKEEKRSTVNKIKFLSNNNFTLLIH